MTFAPPPPPPPPPARDRRQSVEHRLELDRRKGVDRRGVTGVTTPAVEPPEERRSGADRRVQVERRLSIQSAADQIHGALKLLTTLADGDTLREQDRRGLEAAMLRLRFALDRIEGKGGST